MHRPYDNSQTVDDESAVLADFVRRSRQVYRELPHRADVPYADGHRSTMDVFDVADAVGTVVFIHGGYWQWCDKTDFAFIVPVLQRQGCRCVLLEYDLAPRSRLPAIVRQVGQALDALQARSWGTGPLILMGHSAGAHLAACHLDHPAVGAAHLLSGIYDLAPIRGTHLDDALQLSDADIAQHSPLCRPPAVRVPTVVAVGALELPELRMQSAQFGQVLGQVPPPGTVSCRVLPGCNHYDILDAYCASLPCLPAPPPAGISPRQE